MLKPAQPSLDPRGAGRGRAVDWTIGVLGVATALAIPFAALVAPRADVVAVVLAPGSAATELVRVVAEAEGAILDAGGAGNVVIARSDRDGFAARLYAAGARLVLDAGRAAGCGTAGRGRSR